MLSNERKLGRQLNRIDSNKKDGLEREEIDRFLGNERKLQKLGKIMQEAFGDESEKLQEYKENVGKICERILEKDSININQGKILFFYLKHFHNEDTGIGIDIIKTVIDGSKGNRFGEVTSNMANISDQDREEDETQEIIDNRFNNLPGVRELREAWENLEKCRKLLEGGDLSLEDIQRLNEYKENGDLDSDLINTIEEKIQLENLKRCERLIESVDILFDEDMQWLIEYKESLDQDSGQEIICRIEERLKLEEADQDIQGEVYDEIHSNFLSNIENICPGLETMVPNWEIITENIKLDGTETLDAEGYLNILNEKVTASVTEENISQYLQLPEGVTEEDKYYITNNFQSILINHLLLHPGHKISWGLNPKEKVTSMSLGNMVEENNLLESAYKKLDELKNNQGLTFDKLKGEQKNKILEEILNENNHILFDLRLKNELSSCNKNKVGDVIAYVMNFCNRKYPGRLKEFTKNNSFINSVYQEYIEAKRQAEEEKRRIEGLRKTQEEVEKYVNQAENVNIPKNVRNNFNGVKSFIIFSRKQIANFKDYYEKVNGQRWDNESYDYFCKLYESSQSFYESDWIKDLLLPNDLRAQDYVNFVGSLQSMNDDIAAIEREESASYGAATFTPGSMAAPGAMIMAHGNHFGRKKKVSKIQAIREYVKLWKKSDQAKKPDDFLGVPLNWRYSEIDDIIRDSALEGLRDKLRTFGRDATGGRCWQQVFGDVIGLAGGLVASSAAMVTGNTALAGAAYYLGNKLGNSVGQLGWDLFVDGLGKRVLGWGKESGSNKYDGFDASIGLGLGLYKRDENGDVIQAKSQTERMIDTLFGTLATAATFRFAANLGITVNENPFKYASIDEFINKPISNTWAAGAKAWLGTESYEGISVNSAMESQLKEEFGLVGIAKKITNIIVVTGMVKFARRWSKSDSDLVKKIDSGLERLESFLKTRGYNVNDLQKMTEGELKNLMKQGLSGVISDLGQEVQKGWKAVVVPVIPLAMNGLISTYESPKTILATKMRVVLEKKQNKACTPEESERYNKLLERYKKLEEYIGVDMQNMDVDTNEMMEYMESQGLGSMKESHHAEISLDSNARQEVYNEYSGNLGGDNRIYDESTKAAGTIVAESHTTNTASKGNISLTKNIYSEGQIAEGNKEIVTTSAELEKLKAEIKQYRKDKGVTADGVAGNKTTEGMVKGILYKYGKKVDRQVKPGTITPSTSETIPQTVNPYDNELLSYPSGTKDNKILPNNSIGAGGRKK